MVLLTRKGTAICHFFSFFLHAPPSHKLKLVYLPADGTGCILFPHCARYFHLQIQILDCTKSERSEVNWNKQKFQSPWECLQCSLWPWEEDPFHPCGSTAAKTEVKDVFSWPRFSAKAGCFDDGCSPTLHLGDNGVQSTPSPGIVPWIPVQLKITHYLIIDTFLD